MSVVEPMYDESGQEALTRVDYARRLLILSNQCRGRHAVIAVLTMMLSAWQHETKAQPLEYQQLGTVASVMERFLVDLELTDAAIQQLSSSPSVAKPRPPWRAARRLGLAAALAGSLAAAWWATDLRRTATTPPDADQVVTVSAPLPNLARDKSLTTVTFSKALGTTASHPIDPAFAVFTADQQILRIDADGTEHQLTQAEAPLLWLSFSPSGQYLAACDISRNLYLVPWDGQAPTRYAIADYGTPLTVTVDDVGIITWMDDQSKLFTSDPRAQSTTRLLGYEQAVPDSRDGNVIATVQQNANHHELQIDVDGQPLVLRTQLRPDQLINDVDAAENQQTLAVMLSDSLLLVFRATGEGRYRIQEHQFPAATGSAQVRVARDGRTALVATDKLYRFDLQQMRITAALTLPADAGPIYDLAWRENRGEIAVATAKQGLLWK